MAAIEINFTKAALDLLPPAPPRKRLEAHDTKTPGLVLRVTDKGVKSFAVYRRVNGKPQRVTLGRYPDMPIERARKAARDAVAKMADGIDPVAEKRADRARAISLGGVFDDYLASRDLKPGTVHDYRRIMKEAFDDWKKRPILEITKDMVERRHKKLGTASQARANNAMRVLRALFNYAAGQYEDEHGGPLVTENPVRRLSATRKWYNVTRRKTVIKKHDLLAWLDAVMALDPGVYGSPAATARDYLLFLLFTGLRRSEAARLTRADVDLRERAFTIHDTKNREPHTLPLPDYLYDLLRTRLAKIDTNHVFSAARADAPLNDPRTWMEQVANQSGIPFALHDLRRTFTTVAESLDIPAYTLKRLLNHKMDKADVTAGYIVSDVERLRRPMRQISEYLLRLAKIKQGANVVPMSRRRG